MHAGVLQRPHFCYLQRPATPKTEDLLSQLFQELKRRNVIRVAIAYLAVGWLILQVAQLVLESTSAPDWVMQVFLLAVAVGFPIAVLFAWAFEMTAEGIKREVDVDREASITRQTGRKLNRTIIIVLAAAVAFLLVDKFVLQSEPAPTVAEVDKSVAVLPFVAMSSGPDDEYFADGLTEEILNSLTRLPELLVTARTSAFHFKGQDVPIPEIAAALGVAHVVEGSVRRSGERLRVTAQLIRANDGFHLWSETYDHDANDVFGVQTDIAEKIAMALDVVLDDTQLEKMRSFGLHSPEAYVAFQKGVEIYQEAHGSAQQLEKLLIANDWFEKTLALAPGFSDAYSYHADYFTHLLMGDALGDGPSGYAVNDVMSSFEDDLNNAMRYAPEEARRSANAYDLDFVAGRWRGLQSRFERIVDENSCYQPNWPEVITSPFGEAADVRKLGQRQIECDPLEFSGWMISSTASQWLGDFEAAMATARLGFEATGHRIMTANLVSSLMGAGRFEEAKTIVHREIRAEEAQLSRLLKISAAEGDEATANTLLAQLEPMTTLRNDLMINRAVAGQRQRANEIAAEIDSAPFGYLTLVRAVHSCLCGAPFDLEATPGLADRIEEAGLPWPPLSPINWPLKDW
jgi:TolB-like protein